jgi:hypothetical protein
MLTALKYRDRRVCSGFEEQLCMTEKARRIPKTINVFFLMIPPSQGPIRFVLAPS